MIKLPEPGYDVHLQGGTITFRQKAQPGTRTLAFDVDTGAVEELSEERFQAQRLGPRWRELKVHLPGDLGAYACYTDPDTGERGALRFDEGVLVRIDAQDQLIERIDLDRHYASGHAIYSLAFEAPDAVWLAFPSGATVSKFSLTKRQEVFRIGDFAFDEVEGAKLSYPEDLCRIGGTLYVANMGSGSLVALDLSTLQSTVVRAGLGHLWEYKRSDRFEVFRIEDDIFYEAV